MAVKASSAAVSLATLDDVPSIKRVVVGAYSKYIERIGKPPAPMTADYGVFVENRELYVLRDADGTRTVGAIVLSPDEALNSIQIRNLVVDAEAQGCGYGRVLMAYAEKLARDSGRSALTLYTNIKMHENFGLYAKMGFVETERRTEDGYERAYFRKDLERDACRG